MNRIQARSPFFIKYTDTDLVSVIIQLYIYTGDRGASVDGGDRPLEATYQVELDAYNDECIFDASEMIEDYIDVTFDGTYTSQMVWVDYIVTPTLLVADEEVVQDSEDAVELEGYDGFRYFEDGAQNVSRADDTNKVLISDSCLYKGKDAVVRIPVIADSNYDIQYLRNGVVVYEESITEATNTNNRIVYVSNDSVNGVDNLEERIIADGGSFESSYCLDSLLGTIELYDVDFIIIDGLRICVEDLRCSKYEQYKITFVNKFGVLQDVYFDGKSTQSLRTKSESKYRSNTLVSDSYSTSSHNTRMLTKNGVDSMKLSTGFVTEECKEAFKELELSKQVWIEKDGKTLPVVVKDGQFKYKTSLNDNLISYEIDIEFAFSSISNIR